MHKRTLLISVTLGSLLAVGFGGPTAMADVVSAAQAEQTAASSDCVVFDESGNQKWFGEADMNVTALGTALQEVVDERPDQTTGVALCSHFEGATVFVESVGDEVNGAITKIASEFSDLKVTIRQVGASLATLIATGTELLNNAEVTKIAIGVGPDMYTGGLFVEVAPDRWPLSDADRQQVVEHAETISASLSPTMSSSSSPTESASSPPIMSASSLPIRFEQGGESELSTRGADSSPYYMGAELKYSGNSVCSAGVPIVISGVRRLLTAGHCTGSSFYNNGTLVGTTYTSSYPGNASIYGDWKLIKGSNYASRVFSGSLSSNSSLVISGAVWGGRPNGTGACSSGRTTAQICRYYVTGSYTSHTWLGVNTGQLLRMKHDSSGTGSGADHNGWGKGDSGGPVYFSDGKGAVTVAAIVTGRNIGSSSTVYYATQLSGVRAWNSGANVVGG